MISILYTYPEYYYGNFVAWHLLKKTAVMKKIFAITSSLFFVVVAVNAQDEKQKPPPPPPPKPKEVVKYNAIKDEKEKTQPVVKVKGKMADEFYEKNPSISDISRQGNVITLKMKDGTTEKYDMSKKEEDKNFTDKYGRSPIPPPPPPKPKEVIKYKVVDEKVKEPPPPPPPAKQKVKT